MKEEEKFEQYKLFIESAEKNSDKRITQNNIYLTINIAFISWLTWVNELNVFFPSRSILATSVSIL